MLEGKFACSGCFPITVGSVVLGKTTSDTKLNLLGYGEVSLDKVEQIAL